MARPEKKIDWDLVDELIICGSPGTEIAAHFDMHPDTLYKRIEEEYNLGFTAYCQEKRQIGDALIRKAQFQKALGINKDADNTMLIWLGKNRLGQREKEKDEADSTKILLELSEAIKKQSNIKE